jgi:membrane protein
MPTRMTPAEIVQETWREWREDRAQLQAAALAFYALFSFAPVILLTTAVLSVFFGKEAAESRLAVELQWLFTPQVAAVIESLVQNASAARTGWAAGGLGLLVSLWGSTRGFLHLQATLNLVFGVKAIRGPGLLEIVRRRALAFASVGLCGSLMLVSLSATLILHSWADRAVAHTRWALFRAHALEEVGTFFIVSLLLTVVYKTLPDVRIRWRDVLVGAGVSALMFVLSKHAIALWLRHVGTHSTFGAASAIVALLLYVDYVAQVLLLGAEFTFVLAKANGRAIEPTAGAARVVRTVIRDEIITSERPG